MTTKTAVDRGREIVAQIDALSEELKAIEKHLKEAALTGPQVALTDADRDGRQYLAKGTTGVLPVVITADLISQTFADGSPLHSRLESIAGEKLREFYLPKTTWSCLAKDGKQFRQQAGSILESKAPEFIAQATVKDKFGVPRNQLKIDWSRFQEANLNPEAAK